MKNLSIEQTQYTPKIELSIAGELSFVGKSYPENTFEFYKPVMEWLEAYFEDPAPSTTLKMEIVYFNSSSSKLFFDLFDLLDESRDKSSIEVHWIYDPENESAQEAGEDFIADFEDLAIKLVAK